MSSADTLFNLTGTAWWAFALDTPLAWRCALILLVVTPIVAWLWVRLVRLGWHARSSAGAARRRETGTATVEFALVFPVLLVLVLTLIQTTLVFTGNLFVHYAAFSATRSAIVELPRDAGAEDENQIAGQQSDKLEVVRRAAVMAMLPVSGPGRSDRASLTPAVEELYALEGRDTPRWANTLLDRRFGYAEDHTEVTIHRAGVENGETRFVAMSPGVGTGGEPLGPRDAVAVEVRHRLHLSVPFVSRIFSDGTHSVAGRSERYASIRARFILTNEGVVDELPEKPPIPRK